MANPLVVDGRNFLDRDALPARASHTRASAAPQRRASRQLMQALVLAGGEGTRLRPLTLTTPKPVLPLAGRPFLSFMLDWLHGHGVEEAILSLGFLSDACTRVLGDIQSGMRLRYVTRRSRSAPPAPVRLAADEGILAEPLLVLNGDVLTDMDLTAELAPARAHGRARHARADRGRRHASYGVVPTERGGASIEFLEKQPGPGADQPDQRRRLRARAVGDRVDPRRARGVVRARGVPAARRQRPVRLARATATGSTSGRPSATSRRPGTCSPGASSRRCPSATRPARSSTSGSVTAGAHIGPQSVLGRHCSVGSRLARSSARCCTTA